MAVTRRVGGVSYGGVGTVAVITDRTQGAGELVDRVTRIPSHCCDPRRLQKRALLRWIWEVEAAVGLQ